MHGDQPACLPVLWSAQLERSPALLSHGLGLRAPRTGQAAVAINSTRLKLASLFLQYKLLLYDWCTVSL